MLTLTTAEYDTSDMVVVTLKTRVCRLCGADKSLDEFYREAKDPDGKQTACSECMKKRAQKRHADNRDRANARTKAYLTTPEGRAARASHNAAARLQNLQQEQARHTVYTEVRAGRMIVGTCTDANPNCSGKIEFDHTQGYDEPNWLVGEWRCHVHHRLRHYVEKHGHLPIGIKDSNY